MIISLKIVPLYLHLKKVSMIKLIPLTFLISQTHIYRMIILVREIIQIFVWEIIIMHNFHKHHLHKIFKILSFMHHMFHNQGKIYKTQWIHSLRSNMLLKIKMYRSFLIWKILLLELLLHLQLKKGEFLAQPQINLNI